VIGPALQLEFGDGAKVTAACMDLHSADGCGGCFTNADGGIASMPMKRGTADRGALL
jgi:hypothetical protein